MIQLNYICFIDLWISSMPVIYFERLITVYKNLFIDQLNTISTETVSTHLKLIFLTFKFYIYLIFTLFLMLKKN